MAKDSPFDPELVRELGDAVVGQVFAELGGHVSEVGLHRLDRDSEQACDLFLGQSSGAQLDHLGFAGGELWSASVQDSADDSGDGGGEDGAAVGDGVDGRDQVLQWFGLVGQAEGACGNTGGQHMGAGHVGVEQDAVVSLASQDADGSGALEHRAAVAGKQAGAGKEKYPSREHSSSREQSTRIAHSGPQQRFSNRPVKNRMQAASSGQVL